MPAERILVADDEADIRDFIRITLEAEGFEITEAVNGQEALDSIKKNPPHIAILDSRMPKMNGEDVCLRLKQDILLRHLPIIMVTAKGEIADKIKGLGAGADDYMVKPFDPAELLARVRRVMHRTRSALDANPLTRLPGNATIMEVLERRIREKVPLAVCYIDLDRFKAFNDAYGFERGDEVIRETARILLEILKELGGSTDFLGHIGGDDFVMVTTPNQAESIAKEIVQKIRGRLEKLHDEAERKKGAIGTMDRQGEFSHYPLLSATVAVVTNETRDLQHVAAIAQIGAELKAKGKKKGGNKVVKDRRAE